MSLSAGDKLGPYEILSPIGAGGMGEVYKARDTRLDRTVAIKVLPDHIAQREDLRSRFEREARTVASLNHPHICTLHDIGNQDGAGGYMVMEYVEGETLAARIERGAIPFDQALKFATQIADALDRAHRAGVTHRDVKPQNIILTRDGVKVLDFGLAKSSSKPAPSEATLTAVLTTEGTVMGTPQYMAPEQFEGREADARSDIWAFGAVLYEMATGQKAFQGKSYSSLVGAILSADPAPMAVKPFTPSWIERLVRRCLNKDPDRRYHCMRDVLLDLESPPVEAIAPPAPGRNWLWQGIAAAGIVIAAVVSFIHFREQPIIAPMRVSLAISQGATIRYLTLSPDGRRLAAVISTSETSQLWLRSLDAAQFQPLAGTAGARHPFWSTDSRTVAFIADDKLRTVPVSGGPPQTLCENAGIGGDGSWGKAGDILFADYIGALHRVSASGGPCTVALAADASHIRKFPEFLPDGKHFLYVDQAANPDLGGIFVASLDNPAAGRRLLADYSSVLYTPPEPGDDTGLLLFSREGTLMAQPFNAQTLQLAGDPIPSVTGVGRTATPPQAAASLSRDGTLIYISAPPVEEQLTWLDRTGKEVSKWGPPSGLNGVSLAPDGNSVAFNSRQTGSLVLLDARGGVNRLTGADVPVNAAVWSPDGSRIALTSGPDLLLKAPMGGGQDEPLLQGGNRKSASDWSRDGRFLVYTDLHPTTGADIWYLTDPLGKGADRKPVPFLSTKAVESQGQLRPEPDGAPLWIAYTSNEFGQDEVYVRPFPSGAGQWRISAGRGSQPRWSRDGKELFYLTGASTTISIMSVPIQPKSGGGLQFGVPAKLFECRARITNVNANMFAYSPHPDGKRFLVDLLISGDEQVLSLITNWRRLVRARKGE